jgi:hypothetical protein
MHVPTDDHGPAPVTLPAPPPLVPVVRVRLPPPEPGDGEGDARGGGFACPPLEFEPRPRGTPPPADRTGGYELGGACGWA